MQTIPWQKIKVLREEIKALKSLKIEKKVSKHIDDPLYGILKKAIFSEENIKEAQHKVFNFKNN